MDIYGVPNTCQMSPPNLPSFTLIAFIFVLILFILDISTNDKKTELYPTLSKNIISQWNSTWTH